MPPALTTRKSFELGVKAMQGLLMVYGLDHTLRAFRFEFDRRVQLAALGGVAYMTANFPNWRRNIRHNNPPSPWRFLKVMSNTTFEALFNMVLAMVFIHKLWFGLLLRDLNPLGNTPRGRLVGTAALIAAGAMHLNPNRSYGFYSFHVRQLLNLQTGS